MTGDPTYLKTCPKCNLQHHRDFVDRGECVVEKSDREAGADFDPIERPRHYCHSAVEPIDAIEAWGLDFATANAVKYIARHRHKGTPLEDLRKAAWYLNRAVANMEKSS